MRNNSARSAGNVLSDLLTRYHLEDEVFRQKIFIKWPEVIGKDLAKICEPVDLKNGILVLKAKNKLWQTELGKKQNELLNSIKSKSNYAKITRIEII